jgi:VanZ family protein
MTALYVSPPGSPAALAVRNIRIAWIAALLLIFVTTLWPRLAIGSGESPIDKFVHAAAFGGLTALFLNTRWLRSIWLSTVLLMVIAAIDEALQAIPQLGRSADLDDWIADVIGIVIAVALWMAVRPVGVGAARLIGQRRRIAADLLLAKPIAWLHLATVAALGFAAGAPLGVLLDSWFVRKAPQPWQYGFIGGLLGMAVGVHALWEAGVRARLRRATVQQPCIVCGTVDPSASPAHASGRCTVCGHVRCTTDWAPIAPLQGSAEMQACIVPIVVSMMALVMLSALSIAIVTALRLRSDVVLRVDTWYQMLPADARILGDLAVVELIGACGLAACRRRLAARVARCGSSCLACGFDLRATAPEAITGNCHECGGGFVRVPETAAAPIA